MLTRDGTRRSAGDLVHPAHGTSHLRLRRDYPEGDVVRPTRWSCLGPAPASSQAHGTTWGNQPHASIGKPFVLLHAFTRPWARDGPASSCFCRRAQLSMLPSIQAVGSRHPVTWTFRVIYILVLLFPEYEDLFRLLYLENRFFYNSR